MSNKKISINDLFNAFDEEESKQRFDRLYAEFSKTAGKEDLKKWYEASKADPNKVFPDSWCTLYCDLWKLVPACQEPDLQKKKQKVLDEMQNILVLNMEFCEKGLIPKREKYLVLNMMIDIFMAGWFKNVLALPAVLYGWMRNKSNQDYDSFYGEDAKKAIVQYVCDKLNEDEKKDVMEKTIAGGPRGDFELALRRAYTAQEEAKKNETAERLRLVKNTGSKEQASLKENPVHKESDSIRMQKSAYSEPREVSNSDYHAEKELNRGKVPFANPGQGTINPPKDNTGSFIKNNIVLVFCLGAFLLLGLLFIFMGVMGKGKSDPEKISEYKKEIEVLQEEKEALEKKVEELETLLEEKELELESYKNDYGDTTVTGDGISIKTDGVDDDADSTEEDVLNDTSEEDTSDTTGITTGENHEDDILSIDTN